jgi:hypothetical protein
MQWLTRSRKLMVAGAAIAFYFAAAIFLKYSYVPLPELPENQIRLKGPFIKFGSTGVAYIAAAPFGELADTGTDPTRSPVMLYENELPLGPPHSLHSDIAVIGHGRFSHWTVLGIVFSTSDNGDPNYNGRRYSVSAR